MAETDTVILCHGIVDCQWCRAPNRIQRSVCLSCRRNPNSFSEEKLVSPPARFIRRSATACRIPHFPPTWAKTAGQPDCAEDTQPNSWKFVLQRSKSMGCEG